MEFLKIKRNGQSLIFKGFIYTKHYVKDENTKCRCFNRLCRGSLLIKELNGIISESQHIHESDAAQVTKLHLLSNLKEAATSMRQRPIKIVEMTIRNIQPEIAV
jgi:hypothetical protein